MSVTKHLKYNCEIFPFCYYFFFLSVLIYMLNHNYIHYRQKFDWFSLSPHKLGGESAVYFSFPQDPVEKSSL